MLSVAGVQIFAQGFVFVLAAVGIGTPEGSPAEFVGASGGTTRLRPLRRTPPVATRAEVTTIITTISTELRVLPPEEERREQEDRPHPEPPEPVVNRNPLA
jgi:hypothetical protein